MNKVSILLLFLLSFVFLFSYNEEIIDSKLEYLESFPDDIEERLELAQLYNQEYMFLESTLQYINILLIEPENLQAWIGLLFVLSYQQNDDGVLGLSKDALKATNNDPTILSIVGFSLSAKQKRYRAINLFKKVMQDDRAHAEDVGLAKIKLAEQYYVIGDFYRYEKINKEYRKAQIAKNETAQNIINHQVRLFTELLIGTEKKDHLVEAFRQYINFGGIDLNFAVKRNIIDNQLANHIYTVDINNRALPVSISSQFHLIKREETNFAQLDKGHAELFTFSKAFYPQSTSIEPFVSLGFCEYKANKDILQYNIGVHLVTDYFNFIADIGQLNTEEDRTYTNFSIYSNLLPFYTLQVANGFGNNHQFSSVQGEHFDSLSASHQFHQIDNIFHFGAYSFSVSYARSLRDKWQNTWYFSTGIIH